MRRDNETLEFEPLLAKSWEVSEDRLSYIFHLRKDVRWHDGTPFYRDDVVFSYDSVRNPKVLAAHLQSYYQDVKSYTKIDSHTVRCEYGKPYFRAFEFCGGIPVVRNTCSGKEISTPTPPAEATWGQGPTSLSTGRPEGRSW